MERIHPGASWRQKLAACAAWLGAALAAALAPAAVVSAQGFSLEQVMSGPFCSQLSAAPRGSAFAWVVNQQGRRNLWVATLGPGGRYLPVQLTHNDKDDGQEIGDVAWASDGRSLVYVQGGDFEYPEKPAPNPSMQPEGVTQTIWLVSLEGSKLRRVADGRGPMLTPDGRSVAFISKDQVWALDLAQPGAAARQLFHGRGRESALRWSPDGQLLAFESHRGDHGFVGVFRPATGELRYMDPTTETDSDPAWSPDSKRLAFVRIPPSVNGYLYGARRSGPPWSIGVADALTGAGSVIWRANAGQGSVYHGIAETNQILWAADDRIVFPWEADGWTHLYSVRAEGSSAPVLLTPGPFEVEQIALTADRQTAVYSSNQATGDAAAEPGDADRLHVWRVPVVGGPVQRLSGGVGIEGHPAVAEDGTLAVLHSDARLPTRPGILAQGSVDDLAPGLLPAAFPAAQLVVPEPVLFRAADGLLLHGQLFLPAEAKGGKRHPAVVFFHGGSRRQMLLGWNPMQYYSNAYAENQYLVSLGYVVLSVNYRSGTGYGLDFREALHYGPTGASEFNDVLGAGRYLRRRADVDPAQIGAWGGSYGGYLTALALARASGLFAAGVDMHGVHDWNLERSFAEPLYRLDWDQHAARTAWESSPLAAVNTWRSPVLLMQGDDDRNVAFAQTVQLAERLREQGTPVEEHVFPDEIHDFLLHRTWLAAYRYESDFFDRKLKNLPATAADTPGR